MRAASMGFTSACTRRPASDALHANESLAHRASCHCCCDLPLVEFLHERRVQTDTQHMVTRVGQERDDQVRKRLQQLHGPHRWCARISASKQHCSSCEHAMSLRASENPQTQTRARVSVKDGGMFCRLLVSRRRAHWSCRQPQHPPTTSSRPPRPIQVTPLDPAPGLRALCSARDRPGLTPRSCTG